MCEIATIPVDTVDPDSDDRDDRISSVVELAQVFYDSNPHGLGVVTISRDEDSFHNRAFKTGWTERGMSATGLYEFLDDTIDDAWRVVVHARFATAGGVDQAGTHPIIINECDETPWSAVVHNGSVNGHTYKRRKLERDGHTFSTEVDSEVIAHETEMPDPDTFGTDDSDWEIPSLRGNLNYVLFSDEMILVYTQGKYHVSDDFTMACNHREFNTEKPSPGEDGWFLFTPDGDVIHRENEKPSYTSKSTPVVGGRPRSRWWSRGTHSSSSRQSTLSATQDSDDTSRTKNAYTRGVETTTRSPDTSDVDKTRETLRRAGLNENPTIGSDEALDKETHAGYFAGADELLCLEHERTFSFVCTDCRRDADFDDEDVGVVYHPSVFYGRDNKGEVNTSVGVSSVARCPSENEWYVGDTCPTCGIDHTAQHLQTR